MGTSRVCVYAICKDESQFVDRWMNSMSEADSVVVLDTGSKDSTVQNLRDRGAMVQQKEIRPWRFDIARNFSLALVPEGTDICVCTDLDEEFEPGWRDKVEAAWGPLVKRLRYRYTWSFQPDGSEGVVFWTDKIHAHGCFCWTHPVHEVLTFTGQGAYVTAVAPGVQLNHHPDPGKSRAQYFPLLELAVRENPDDDRNMHYLGREYLYHQMWDACIETLLKHLSMPTSTWADERAASMRYIARAYEAKEDPQEAKRWLLRAMAEAPYLREGYMEMAFLLYRLQEWEGVLYMVECALQIQERPMTYISEPDAWGAAPYDLGAVACYWLGLTTRALAFVNQALALSPHDERLKRNRAIILKKE